MRPEWTEKNEIFLTHTRTHTHREATQDVRAAFPLPTTSTLSYYALFLILSLSLSHSLSLFPSLSHSLSWSSIHTPVLFFLMPKNWWDKKQKKKKTKRATCSYSSIPHCLPQPVLSGPVIFSPLLPLSVRKRNTCESEHRCWEDQIQVSLWLHLFVAFISPLCFINKNNLHLFLYSLNYAGWTVIICETSGCMKVTKNITKSTQVILFLIKYGLVYNNKITIGNLLVLSLKF